MDALLKKDLCVGVRAWQSSVVLPNKMGGSRVGIRFLEGSFKIEKSKGENSGQNEGGGALQGKVDELFKYGDA